MSLNIKDLVWETEDVAGASRYNSWKSVVMALDKLHFNWAEAEAILKSSIPVLAADEFGKKAGNTSGVLVKHLEKYGYTHKGKPTNALVLETFKEFVADANGVPCREGRNVMSGVKMLVPVGTPASCDPTCETYWSI